MNLPEKIFRAYDIRGIYPKEINEEVVSEIGKSLGEYFGSGQIVAGHDARLSSPALYESLLRALTADRDPRLLIKAGRITTPMLYFLVNKLKARGGIMITASHNPGEYNGLKVVGEGAAPISGEEVLKMMRKT